MLEALKRNRLKRKQTGSFLVEGVAPIESLESNGWAIDGFVYCGMRKRSQWAADRIASVPSAKRYELSEELMDELSDRDETSELLVVAKTRAMALEDLAEDFRLALLLDRPSNPGNTGSIFRSADAFGVDAIILSGHGVDPYDTKVIRSSVGAVFSVPFVTDVANTELEAWIAGVRSNRGRLSVIGTSAHGDVDLERVSAVAPSLLILGNETYGMSRLCLSLCDEVARIPIRGSVSSLNVACAATVALYEIRKQLIEENQ